MRFHPATLFAFVIAAASLALAAAPHRRHPRPGRKHLPTLELASAKPLSLSEAREAHEGSSPAVPAFKLKLVLHGGGNNSWVSESCNPVVPVVNGEMRPLRQCLANFYAKVALDEGRGEPVEFLWPLNDPQHPLKAGDSVRFMMALGSECSKSAGPGLYALGDCKITQQILSATYLIWE